MDWLRMPPVNDAPVHTAGPHAKHESRRELSHLVPGITPRGAGIGEFFNPNSNESRAGFVSMS